jgi:hypothetical protein
MPDSIENEYQVEAKERWPEQYAESNRKLARLTEVEQQVLFAKGPAIAERIAEQFEAGLGSDSAVVQNLIAEHYEWICNFWTPNQAAHAGLADMYVADARFAANYETLAAGFAEFMRLAMRDYAFENLG